MPQPPSYTVRRAPSPVPMNFAWDAEPWSRAETLAVDHFRPESSDHRPVTRSKVLYDDKAIHVLFHVQDRYVRAAKQNFQDRVCEDSCVEFFVEPVPGKGYFNFELNCGGTLLVFHVTDETRVHDEPNRLFKQYTVLPRDAASLIKVAHSMPKRVEPEVAEPTDWSVQFTVPLAVFEPYVGKLPSPAGRTWRGNFFKCGDETSHPHWASWSPVDEFNFHLPRCFAPIHFEP